MFAKARLANHNPRNFEHCGRQLNTLASAQSRRGHEYAIERFIEWYFGILTLAES
jgi:hypothetical protein